MFLQRAIDVSAESKRCFCGEQVMFLQRASDVSAEKSDVSAESR